MFEFKDIPRLSDGALELALVKQMPAKYELFKVPAYYFKILKIDTKEEVGSIEIRIGNNEYTFYAGHIGYEIYPPYQGNYYAAAACELVKEVALMHRIDKLYICCLPTNIPSNKVILRLGGKFFGTYLVPFYHEMYYLGIDKVNIYQWDIEKESGKTREKLGWFQRIGL